MSKRTALLPLALGCLIGLASCGSGWNSDGQGVPESQITPEQATSIGATIGGIIFGPAGAAAGGALGAALLLIFGKKKPSDPKTTSSTPS